MQWLLVYKQLKLTAILPLPPGNMRSMKKQKTFFKILLVQEELRQEVVKIKDLLRHRKHHIGKSLQTFSGFLARLKTQNIWKAMMDHLSKNLECQLLQICTGAAHMVAGKEDLNLVGTKILWLFTNLHLDFPLSAESVSS